MQWFTKAAEQGHIQAQYNLGICYTYGHGVEQNHIIAEEWFSKAAQQKIEHGNIEAQYQLDLYYYNDKGVPQTIQCFIVIKK
jgi:hypothetical protein